MILSLRQHGIDPDNADAIYCKDVLLPSLVGYQAYLTPLGDYTSYKIWIGRGDGRYSTSRPTNHCECALSEK